MIAMSQYATPIDLIYRFPPGTRVTVIARYESNPERDYVVTNDEPEEAVKALARSAERATSRAAGGRA